MNDHATPMPMPMLLAMALGLALGLGSLPAAAQHASASHGDHNAHHGGAVDMWGILHYEVVLPPAGGVAVYFSDEMRSDLPASAVTRLRAEIVRPNQSIESVAMAINATGDRWQGRSRPVINPKSVIRLAFVHRGEQAMVEIYGDMVPRLAKAAPQPAAKANPGPKPGPKSGPKSGPKPAGSHAGH